MRVLVVVALLLVGIVAGSATSARAAAVGADTVRWPGPVIDVYVDPGLSRTSARYQYVIDAMQAWQAQTGVRFQLLAAPARTMLLVAENQGEVKSCYATVGFTPQLHWDKRTFSGGYLVVGTCSRGSVLHEFGHVLGLMHEHQRSDRDLYIDTSAIADAMRACRGLLPRCGEVPEAINAAPRPERLRSDYDPCSLMHYLADQSAKPKKGRLPPSAGWAEWYRLTPAGEANARACRAMLTPVPDCGWQKTGQKCEITCQDANLVATFYGLPARRQCWTTASRRRP